VEVEVLKEIRNIVGGEQVWGTLGSGHGDQQQQRALGEEGGLHRTLPLMTKWSPYTTHLHSVLAVPGCTSSPQTLTGVGTTRRKHANWKEKAATISRESSVMRQCHLPRFLVFPFPVVTVARGIQVSKA
jgi:hypothetical protein